MSSFLNEQSDEIEVLMSIFPSEFELLSTNPNIFQIKILPCGNDEVNHGK